MSYEGADSVFTSSTNVYDMATHNVRYSTANASDGSVIVSKFKYPEDYISGLSAAFISANVLGLPWETQTWRKRSGDSVLVKQEVTEFSSTSFLPLKKYLHNGLGTTALDNEAMSGGKYSSLLSDSHLEERISFAYDSASRIISQLPTGGVPVSYRWGYVANPLLYGTLGQKNYPIAEAVNALPSEFYYQNFEEAASASSGNAHTGSKYLSGDYAVSWTVPNGRGYVLSYWYLDGGKWKLHEQAYTGSTTLTLGTAVDDVVIAPKDASVSTFCYLIGIGLSSRTDAKGMTTYFGYDGLNRLKAIRDGQDNILKTYDYHFKP